MTDIRCVGTIKKRMVPSKGTCYEHNLGGGEVDLERYSRVHSRR